MKWERSTFFLSSFRPWFCHLEVIDACSLVLNNMNSASAPLVVTILINPLLRSPFIIQLSGDSDNAEVYPRLSREIWKLVYILWWKWNVHVVQESAVIITGKSHGETSHIESSGTFATYSFHSSSREHLDKCPRILLIRFNFCMVNMKGCIVVSLVMVLYLYWLSYTSRHPTEILRGSF